MYFVASLFIPTDDQQRKERILEGMSSAPQHVMVSAMEGRCDYDAAAVAEGCAVPAFYVAADESQPHADMAPSVTQLLLLKVLFVLGNSAVSSP